MSVLVTGGTGYIGSHTCVELIQAGYDILVVDNLVNSSDVSLRRIQEITGKEVPFILADLCKEELVEDIFRNHPEIDSVMHFAGLKAVGESVAMPLEYYDNNLFTTITLCHQCLTL